MVDYSRFDKIDDLDSDEEQEERKIATPQLVQAPQPVPAAAKGRDGRIKFEFEGRTIYEWEQSLTEVNLYITPPPGVKPSMIDCQISSNHLRLGIKGNPPFIDEPTGGPVRVSESYWMINDGELNINLQKMYKGQAWTCALQGRGQLDPISQEEVQRKLMLERFQEEHPGFDFSNAEFNGTVPDARTFMGGIKEV